ncbi:MAG: tail fiber domain-containing protein [Enterobacteriaceae bacterium]|nr:tail fiber domain-containing protein [Enterobacteriaceae bacterium]
MIYTTGSIAVNGNTLTGTGTNFTAAGSLIRVGCSLISLTTPPQVFQITAINSATQLTVTPAANPAIAAGTAYAILLSDSLSVDGLAQNIAETLTLYQRNMSGFADVMNGAGDVTITTNGVAVTVPGQKSLAKKGANSDITSLSGLTTALSIAQGGTGAKTAADARTAMQLGPNDVPYFSSIELTSSTPFIDFHFGKDPGDYTARIIQAEANALEVGAATGSLSFRINGGVRVGGASYAGGINIYRGNGDANALWGLNCSDGNLNIARGSGAGGTIMLGDSVINSVKGIFGKQGSSGPYQGNTWQFYWNISNQLEAWIDTSKVGIVSLSSTSDKGLKKDIKYRNDADTALGEVLQWRPADFKMKARGIIPETETMLGFIANDLIAVSPECVSGKGLPEDYDIEADPNNPDAYYLNQVPMIAKLTQAVQAQQKLINDLTARVSELEAMGKL